MFAKSVVRSDEFHQLPIKSQYLYFQLGIEADDDGFLNNPKGVLKFNDCAENDLKLLIMSGFIYRFESGVVVILDWLVSNQIKADRYHPTDCFEEFNHLIVKKRLRYTIVEKNEPDTSCVQEVSGNDPDCIQYDSSLETEESVGKDSQDKFSEGEIAHRHVNNEIRGEIKNYGKFGNVSLSLVEYNEIVERNYLTTLNKLSLYMKQHNKTYTNHFATVLIWGEEDDSKRKSDLPDYSTDSEKKEPLSQLEIEQLKERLSSLGIKQC